MSNKSKIIELINQLEKDVEYFKCETKEDTVYTPSWNDKTIKKHTIVIKIKDE